MPPAMTEYLTYAYGFAGFLSLMAYGPQILKLITATGRSIAVSLQTWGLWVATSSTTLLYAIFVVQEPMMIAVSLGAWSGNVAVYALTFHNRYIRFPAVRDPMPEMAQTALNAADTVRKHMLPADQSPAA